MPEWLVTFLSNLKPSAITYCGIALVCSLLLFMPKDFIVFLGLYELIKEHRPWVGITWLISTCFVAVYFFKFLTPIVKEHSQRYSIYRQRIKFIKSMSSNQKTVLMGFRRLHWKEQRLDYDSAAVNQLVQIGILVVPKKQLAYRTENITCLYFVSNWARKYFDKHPKYLVLASSDIVEKIK